MNRTARILLFEPNVRINGMIDQTMLLNALDQLSSVRASDQPLILEISTLGGDPDAARRVASEVRLIQSLLGKETYCVGRTTVYSAGIVVMAAFPNSHRYLTSDTTLLIHERHNEGTVHLNGPLKGCIQIAREKLAMLETAERIEKEEFSRFVEGSRVSVEELYERAKDNCYLTADEALELGLIAKIVDQQSAENSLGKRGSSDPERS